MPVVVSANVLHRRLVLDDHCTNDRRPAYHTGPNRFLAVHMTRLLDCHVDASTRQCREFECHAGQSCEHVLTVVCVQSCHGQLSLVRPSPASCQSPLLIMKHKRNVNLPLNIVACFCLMQHARCATPAGKKVCRTAAQQPIPGDRGPAGPATSRRMPASLQLAASWMAFHMRSCSGYAALLCSHQRARSKLSGRRSLASDSADAGRPSTILS